MGKDGLFLRDHFLVVKCALDRRVGRTHPVSAAERELLICLFFTNSHQKHLILVKALSCLWGGGCGQCQAQAGLFCFPCQNCINPLTDITPAPRVEGRAALLSSGVEWPGPLLTATSPVLLPTGQFRWKVPLPMAVRLELDGR